jgi:hypothetical protein
MLNRILLVAFALAIAWFFAVASVAWLVGAVPLCDATFDANLCAAVGVH